MSGYIILVVGETLFMYRAVPIYFDSVAKKYNLEIWRKTKKFVILQL